MSMSQSEDFPWPMQYRNVVALLVDRSRWGLGRLDEPVLSKISDVWHHDRLGEWCNLRLVLPFGYVVAYRTGVPADELAVPGPLYVCGFLPERFPNVDDLKVAAAESRGGSLRAFALAASSVPGYVGDASLGAAS
jgi:hypothetical protein